jgi:hypothetical protein
MTRKFTFSDHRMQMLAAVDDASTIANDLGKYATILAELARFLNNEAASMKRAEERFSLRSETKKAAVESRPLPPTN